MSRQAIVGAFTLLGLVALFVVYFVLSNLSAKVSGYQIGVHFASAAGLTRGAVVYESGVQIGTVSQIRMLNDFSVDVVMQIVNWAEIPRDSEFVISAPLTGGASVTIVPPRRRRDESALLPRYVLPVDQQPQGTNPVSVQELLEAGRGELTKMNQLMTDIAKREPKLMDQLQSAITNANQLAIAANGLMQNFAKHGDELTSTLQRSLDSASANIVDLSGQLDQTVRRNGGRIDTLLVSLNRTADSLSAATGQLQRLSANPALHDDVLTTTHQMAEAMSNIAALTGDLRKAAESSQTQGQLRDTLAHIDAASQRASSLLGALGGTSSVYGVDAGATPPPSAAPSGERIVPATPAPGVPSPQAADEKKKAGFQLSPAMRDRIGDLAKNLFEIQMRLTELSTKSASAPTSPILGADRGPQSDFNVVVLPHADSQLFAGVNDLSGNQTWNFALRQRLAPGLLAGGGILYSRLGVMGIVSNRLFGFEGLAYDPRYGYVDTYLRFRATPNIDLLAGERDVLHSVRRTTFGLQYRFLGGQ